MNREYKSNSRGKERLKKVVIGIGATAVAVGVGAYKLLKKNNDDNSINDIITDDVINPMEENILEYDEFINPVADIDFYTREEFEEHIRDMAGDNAEELIEKIESASQYGEVYLASSYEDDVNYHEGAYYTEPKEDGLGSMIAYDLYTDEYVGGDPFELVKDHTDDGFPEHHWE